MIFVALLRGINVGGNNKVDMKQLKAVFEKLGFTKVKTYINSGNVIFESDLQDKNKIIGSIEHNIEMTFGSPVKVLLRDYQEIEKIFKKLPDS